MNEKRQLQTKEVARAGGLLHPSRKSEGDIRNLTSPLDQECHSGTG